MIGVFFLNLVREYFYGVLVVVLEWLVESLWWVLSFGGFVGYVFGEICGRYWLVIFRGKWRILYIGMFVVGRLGMWKLCKWSMIFFRFFISSFLMFFGRNMILFRRIVRFVFVNYFLLKI